MAKRARARKQHATSEYKLPEGMALGLRSCKPDFTSPSHEANGFKWPSSGHVVAPDWIADRRCGHGLHLLAHGEGNGGLLCFDDGAPWLVCEYDPKLAVDLDGKIKVEECTVVFCGDRSSATMWIMAHDPLARSVVGGTATAGDFGAATAGYGGTATAGCRGTATAGDGGTATAGYGGTATAGDGGTATVGDFGAATVGYGGTATAGDRGTARSGDVGIVVVRWYDYAKNRCRLSVGYVGEDGIEPNTFYRCDESGKLVKA